MFVCCSFTARKGLNILIYWIIVRVLSSSRPYQALIFQTKANNQIRSATKLSLSFESSRPLQLGWKMVLGAAPPIHSSQVIGNLTKFKWKLSLSSKQSSSRSTRPAHKLIENWMILFENKRIEKNLQPPSSPRLLHPGFHLPLPPCWLAGWSLGRGDLILCMHA